MFFFAVHLDRQRAAFGVTQRGLERFRQPLLGVLTHPQAVDNDIHRVLVILFQLRQIVDFVDLAIDSQTRETLCAQFVEQIRLLALAPADQRRHDHHARVWR